MNIAVAHPGALKESWFREAFAEYQKRTSPFASLEEIVFKPAKTGSGALSPAEIEACLAAEAEEFQKLFSSPKYARAFKIALCVEGKQMTSESFARLFADCRNTGKSTLLFLIGGSWGMAESVKKACDMRLSFSEMTFPHSLFAVMLSEQIYRAFSILEKKGYHK